MTERTKTSMCCATAGLGARALAHIKSRVERESSPARPSLRAREIELRPHVFIASVGSRWADPQHYPWTIALWQDQKTVASVLKAAGLERSTGLVTATFLKDPTDPQWVNDRGMKEWIAWMRKYYPEGDTTDWYNVFGYALAQAIVHVLKQCGDNLTRENVMSQATNLKNLELPMLLPGITINTSRTDYLPIKQMRLARFDGARRVRFGETTGD